MQPCWSSTKWLDNCLAESAPSRVQCAQLTASHVMHYPKQSRGQVTSSQMAYFDRAPAHGKPFLLIFRSLSSPGIPAARYHQSHALHEADGLPPKSYERLSLVQT